MSYKALLTTSLAVAASLSAPLLGIQSLAQASEQDPSTLVLAGISDEPAKILRRYQPLTDYLVEHLAEEGVSVGDIRVAPDVETMAEWMANGEVDLFFDSLYPAMAVADRSGSQPILRRWKDGIAEYHSVVFARADRGLTSLDDLVGELFAFEEPFSTSGYLLPLAHFTEAGYNLVSAEGGGSDPTVAADEIGYLFSGEDQNTVQWVITGRVAAGVTDNDNYLELPEATRARLTILAETEPLPRQVAVVRPNMDAEFQAALAATLIDMDESEAGRAALDEFKNTAQFDEFPEGAEAAIARMRELYELANSQ